MRNVPDVRDNTSRQVDNLPGRVSPDDEKLHCSKCNQNKIITDFSADRKNAAAGLHGGRSYWCKQCVKENDEARKNSKKGTPKRQERQETGETVKYQAMLNCPTGSVNTSMLTRAAKVTNLLRELAELNPEDAATMMPVMRTRMFADADAEWWSRFTAACEKRRAEEIPGYQPFRPMTDLMHHALKQ